MDFKTSDVFDDDKISELIIEAVDEGLGKTQPNKRRLKRWGVDIGEELMERISNLKSPLKYLVFIDLMEDNGSGYQSYLSAMWEPEKDNFTTYEITRPKQNLWGSISVIGVSL